MSSAQQYQDSRVRSYATSLYAWANAEAEAAAAAVEAESKRMDDSPSQKSNVHSDSARARRLRALLQELKRRTAVVESELSTASASMKGLLQVCFFSGRHYLMGAHWVTACTGAIGAAARGYRRHCSQACCRRGKRRCMWNEWLRGRYESACGIVGQSCLSISSQVRSYCVVGSNG